jgi:hypothetical protein
MYALTSIYIYVRRKEWVEIHEIEAKQKPFQDANNARRRSFGPYYGATRRDDENHRLYVERTLAADKEYQENIRKITELGKRSYELREAGELRKKVLNHRRKAVTAKIRGKYERELKELHKTTRRT